MFSADGPCDSRQIDPAGDKPMTLNTPTNLLDDHGVAAILGCARGSLQKRRLTGDGPPFVRIGRLVRYRPDDVAAWIEAKPALRSTSQG
jgi:predicted DNA-binding transcriptional regulator AlpA